MLNLQFIKFLRRIVVLGAFVFACGNTQNLFAHNSVAPTLSQPTIIPVRVSDQAVIDVELFTPRVGKSKALVVVVPGTGGIADPYFDYEIVGSAYSPHHRGGLVDTFIAAGFSVAFYNQRGYRLLSTCVLGKNEEERRGTFVAYCVDQNIRVGVDLLTITSDTEKIFSALSQYPYSKDQPVIALAISEGMHHTSTLAGQNRIKVAGIVSIGGPVDSLSTVVEYQLTAQFYYTLVSDAMQRCKLQVIDINDIKRCARPKLSSFASKQLAGFFALGPMTLAQLDSRRLQSQQQYQAFVQKAAEVKTPYPGNFGRFVIPNNWSPQLYHQFFQSKQSVLRQLEGFSGHMRFLVGSADAQIPIPAAGSCKLIAVTTKSCEIQIFEGLGHMLEGENDELPSQQTLKRIVSAVQSTIDYRP
jgi:hypothetical protein